MEYTEKLLNPKWQKLRLKVFERDNWTCQASDCGATEKPLHAHHYEYLAVQPWEYPIDMLTTLCEDCHKKENNRYDLERHLATTLKMKGFLISDLLAMSCKLETDIIFTKTLLNVLRNFQNG